MSEKEKMLAGEDYLLFDKELDDDREKAKLLCYKMNQLDSRNIEGRIDYLKELINCKDSAYVEPPFYCAYGYNITVGKRFFANHNCTILDTNKVDIGDYVMIGPNVQIAAACHPLDFMKRREGIEFSKPIKIEDDVWIGASAVILPGITIGKCSVVGAGSVVTKDVPANVVVAGNPAKIIKKL